MLWCVRCRAGMSELPRCETCKMSRPSSAEHVCVAAVVDLSRSYVTVEGDSLLFRRLLKAKRMELERELWCECACLPAR